MYAITQLLSGKWYCQCMVQDGCDRWEEDTREEAVRSLIRAARSVNSAYIREDDIVFQKQDPKPPVSEETKLSTFDEKMLREIKSGQLKVLPFDHYLLKYRITEKEAEMMVKVREGEAYVRYYD